MRHLEQQKGFTLVELAIVMTIIGLLIGGILRGQELMENARVTATVAQVKAFEAATTTFRDAYNAIPGDMLSADARLPGCAGATLCNANATGGGNGIVGTVALSAANDAPWASQSPTVTAAAPAANTGETYLFWQHLFLANLIGGVTDESVRAAGVTTAWNVTHPAARIGGGFIVMNAPGFRQAGSTQTGAFITGLTLALVQDDGDAVASDNAAYPLLASKAAQIDRKMDDGRPGVGFVQGFGTAASPAGGAGCSINVADGNYNEAGANRSCGLLFRIQG